MLYMDKSPRLEGEVARDEATTSSLLMMRCDGHGGDLVLYYFFLGLLHVLCTRLLGIDTSIIHILIPYELSFKKKILLIR